MFLIITSPEPNSFQQQMFDKESITIKDTLVSPTYELDMQLYLSCMEGSGQEFCLKGSSSNLFRTILTLYTHGINENQNIRKTIDLLFHYFYEVGIAKKIREDGTIEYYGLPQTSNLTSTMKIEYLKSQNWLLEKK